MGLNKWFEQNWVDIGSKKPGGGFRKCGRSKLKADRKRKYPKCVPAARAARMSDKQIASAVRRKRAKKQGVGGKPTNVATFAKDGGIMAGHKGGKMATKGGTMKKRGPGMQKGGMVKKKGPGMMKGGTVKKKAAPGMMQGGSIKKAISSSTNKYIIIFDLDEYLIEDLIKGHKIIESDKKIDFLCGSRFGENNRFIYKKNLYGVIVLTKLINLLYKINLSDSACATKIFKREIYDKLKISTNGFDFEFEVLCKFAKLSNLIKEYKDLRTYSIFGNSKILLLF